MTRFSPNVHMEEMSIFHYPVIRGMSTFHTSLGTNAGIMVDDVFFSRQLSAKHRPGECRTGGGTEGPPGHLVRQKYRIRADQHLHPNNRAMNFRAKISGEYGSYNTFKSSLSLSTPIVRDKLFWGGTFQYRSSDGSYENLGSGDENPTDLEHLNARGDPALAPLRSVGHFAYSGLCRYR